MTRLVLSGELDLAAAPRFETRLDGAQADSGRVLLDLRTLTLIDCAVLFAAAGRARRESAVLILLSPRGQVRRLLDLIGAPDAVAVLDDSDLPDTGATGGAMSGAVDLGQNLPIYLNDHLGGAPS